MWRTRSSILLEKPHSFGAAFGVPAGCAVIRPWFRKVFSCPLPQPLSWIRLYVIIVAPTDGQLFTRRIVSFKCWKCKKKLLNANFYLVEIRTSIDERSIVAWLLTFGVRFFYIIRIASNFISRIPKQSNYHLATLFWLLSTFIQLPSWGSFKSTALCSLLGISESTKPWFLSHEMQL